LIYANSLKSSPKVLASPKFLSNLFPITTSVIESIVLSKEMHVDRFEFSGYSG